MVTLPHAETGDTRTQDPPPALLHSKITMCSWETKKLNNVDRRTGEKLKEEGNENNEQFSNTEN
jgi:hypothetical protein